MVREVRTTPPLPTTDNYCLSQTTYTQLAHTFCTKLLEDGFVAYYFSLYNYNNNMYWCHCSKLAAKVGAYVHRVPVWVKHSSQFQH